jgi:hypothetical protein
MEVTLCQMEQQQDQAQTDHDATAAITARLEAYTRMLREGIELPESIVMLVREYQASGRAS